MIDYQKKSAQISPEVYAGSKELYNQKHSSLLSRSLIIAGVAFLVMCILAFGINSILFNMLNSLTESNPGDTSLTINILFFVSIGLLLVSMFVTFYVSKRIETVKISTVIIAISLYTIAYAIIFGFLFTTCQLMGWGIQDLIFCFAITGGIFTITGFIGWSLSQKAALTVGKFASIATIVYFLMIIPLVILCILNISTAFNTLNTVVFAIFGLLTILYLVYDFSAIKHSQTYINMLSGDVQFKYALFFGFRLLMDLVMLLYYVIRIMSYAKR